MDVNQLKYTLIPLFTLLFGGCALQQQQETARSLNALSAQIESCQVQQTSHFQTLQQQQNESIQALSALQKQQDALIKKIKPMQPPPRPEPVCQQPSLDISGKTIVGMAEWVYFPELERHFKARVDSGATTSSISAKKIQKFERDGKSWVRFDMIHADTGVEETLEAQVVRKVRIRQASADETERRLVVELNLYLGETLKQKAEFTLADRSDMTYPVLLGREFLRDISLIDVGESYLHEKYQPQSN